ncbi:MAG: nuclear transport factor 2 family protein [Gemmatimonadales bacterium]|jgi:hypothetical protein|nr:nuclear transport factor 2 family protein [Gemmatimonadales bacterium]
MRWQGFTVLVVVLLGGCSAPVGSPVADGWTGATRDSVAAALDAFQRLSAAAQWDSVGALYSDAPGFAFYETGALQYASATAIRSALAQVPPGTRIETRYRDTRIEPLAPGIAHVGTLFQTTFADGTGPGFSYGGALSMVWVSEGGSWRIRLGHSSAPVPRGP